MTPTTTPPRGCYALQSTSDPARFIGAWPGSRDPVLIHFGFAATFATSIEAALYARAYIDAPEDLAVVFCPNYRAPEAH